MDRPPTGAPGRERSRAAARAIYVDDLETAGQARAEALRQADAHLDRIALLLPGALSAGLTLAEIARIANVSRPTLYQLRGRYGSTEDLRRALLDAVSERGLVAFDDLAQEIGRPRDELWAHLAGFVDTGSMEVEPIEGEVPEPGFVLTKKGAALLEHLQFEDDKTERES